MTMKYEATRICPECLVEDGSITLKCVGKFSVTMSRGQLEMLDVVDDDPELQSIVCNECHYEGPPEKFKPISIKEAAMAKLVEELEQTDAEEVFPDGRNVEVVLNDNPLTPQLVFDVMAIIAKAHPQDVRLVIPTEGAYVAIMVEF